MESVHITSMKALQERFPEILQDLGTDHHHLLAAAANPLIALEELGYSLSRRVREDLEDRSRFTKEEVATRRQLRRRIFDLAGSTFDVGNQDEVERVLFEDLQIERPRQARQVIEQPKFQQAPQDAEKKPVDPLDRLVDAHPVIEPLLEYRRLDASRPQFAPRERYEAIKSGRHRVPITSLRVRNAGEDTVLVETNANR